MSLGGNCSVDISFLNIYVIFFFTWKNAGGLEWTGAISMHTFQGIGAYHWLPTNYPT